VVAPLSDDPHNYQRLRDLRAHIYERRRHSGSLFQDKERPTPAQFARGVRWAELEGIEIYRRHHQLRWCIDAKIADQKLKPVGRDSAIAHAAGFEFQEVSNTIERRRQVQVRRRDVADAAVNATIVAMVVLTVKVPASARGEAILAILRMRERVLKLMRDTTAARCQRPEVSQGMQPPLRERRKAGRKPVGDRAMTGAERVRKHRATKKQLQALPPQERNKPGVVGPPSLGPAASGQFLDGVQMSQIELLPAAEAASLARSFQQLQPFVGRKYPRAESTQAYTGYKGGGGSPPLKKMPGHKGPGKFEGSLQWNVYQRHGVGATRILVLPLSAAEKSSCTLAMWAQRRPMISSDG